MGKKVRVPPGTKRKTKVSLPFGLTPVQLAGLVALVTVCVIGYSMVYDGSPAKRVPKIPIKKLTKEERRLKKEEYERNKAARTARLSGKDKQHFEENQAKEAAAPPPKPPREDEEGSASSKGAKKRGKHSKKDMVCKRKEELTEEGCTACSTTNGCAWCINHNKCVDDRPFACAYKHRRDPLDQVGYHGKGRCGVIFRRMMYHSHPDQEPVMTCERQKELGVEGQNGCCGDGKCDVIETKHSCEEDCKGARQRRRIYDVKRPKGTRLFKKLKSTQHPAYHCHEAYDKKMDVQWFLDKPSKDLKAELTSREILDLPEGAEVLDIGTGDGRDALYLSSLGFRATGVDIHKKPISIAKAKAKKRDLDAEFLVYDALQLPAPQVPLALVYDNTIYCNLRLEYLEQVLALLDRLTTTGTYYMLNCGNANDKEVVIGHPRLREEVIRRELGPMFEFLKVYEGIYDMKFSGTLSKIAPQWHKDNGGVKSWTMIMRRK